MNVAAFVLGVLGTALAATSLGWNVAEYLLTGARMKLEPIIGHGGATLVLDATTDMRPTLQQLEAQLHDADPADRIIGVTVINKGRIDLCITRWSFRVLPVNRWWSPRRYAVTRWMFRIVPKGPDFLPPTDPGCPELPCTIPPGGTATFLTRLERVWLVTTSIDNVSDPRRLRVVATATSGGRTRTSKPFFKPMLTDRDG